MQNNDFRKGSLWLLLLLLVMMLFSFVADYRVFHRHRPCASASLIIYLLIMFMNVCLFGWLACNGWLTGWLVGECPSNIGTLSRTLLLALSSTLRALGGDDGTSALCPAICSLSTNWLAALGPRWYTSTLFWLNSTTLFGLE